MTGATDLHGSREKLAEHLATYGLDGEVVEIRNGDGFRFDLIADSSNLRARDFGFIGKDDGGWAMADGDQFHVIIMPTDEHGTPAMSRSYASTWTDRKGVIHPGFTPYQLWTPRGDADVVLDRLVDWCATLRRLNMAVRRLDIEEMDDSAARAHFADRISDYLG